MMHRWVGVCRVEAQRWTAAVKLSLLVFGVQLAMILVVSRTASPSRVELSAGVIRWSWDGAAGFEADGELPGSAVLAGAGVGGFSHAVWSGEGRLRGDASGAALPRPVPEEVARSRRRPVEGAVAVPDLSDAWAGKEVSVPRHRIGWAPPVPPRGQVSWRDGGGHGAGGALDWPEPVWTNSEVLAPTRVHVLVGAGGQPLSVGLVVPGSGVAAADQAVVEAARRMAFRAAGGGGDLRWGEVEFVWRTVSPEVARSGQ